MEALAWKYFNPKVDDAPVWVPYLNQDDAGWLGNPVYAPIEDEY